MGLDIYAGTLTRYYSHNWKTVVQQWAEENGYSFNRMARQNMEKANLARDWVSYWVCSGMSALLYCPSESTVPSTGYPSVEQKRPADQQSNPTLKRENA